MLEGISQIKKLQNKNKRRKFLKRLKRLPPAILNYHLGNYEKKRIWLLGDGRSGTTWLGDLINWEKQYRELFEPVHPGYVRHTKKFGFNPYLAPNDNVSAVGKFLHSVFSGRFYHLRADVSEPKLFYQGLLVKDIYGNLLVGWVQKNIPDIKKVMIIRNPFSVALSKQRYCNWQWMIDSKQFLKQDLLMHDHLLPFEHLIVDAGNDFIENQLLIWAIIHYVPFKQLKSSDVYIVFYENLFNNPEKEVFELFSYLHGTSVDNDLVLLDKIRQPSRTQGDKFSTLSVQNPLDVWKNELTSKQIDKGMRFLEEFGLENIYGGNSLPSSSASKNIFKFSEADL